MTEIEKPFPAASGFNTKLVHLPMPYHVIISTLHVRSFMGIISHMYWRATKAVLRARNLVYEKLKYMKAWQTM